MHTRIPREGVVVLNASFEPLGVVPVARAMVYLMRERATIVDAIPGRTLRSAEGEFPFPRVVQFREMIRVPYRFGAVAWSRQRMLERDNFECCYCSGRRATTVDHVFPRSRGGRDTWENTVGSCGPCNSKKADQTPAEAGMTMRYQPRIVTSRETLVLAIAAVGADLEMLGLGPARVAV
ncbi:HNH endonuclease [Microbacterium sp. 77mftsu3.1]|uniref:HNH endonuclease n=1 Tax=Microbacterium sp. 77mftsu3.1 TaxID=1761802 RepID=UPI000374A88D|nr:HNH endonuclease [Microbacterium sp. 77mftsu3.1]SDH47744.1 5-methylcytosine-specific restriction endonuclease McrA [Microbacterium sp. 77mftsu3.1]